MGEAIPTLADDGKTVTQFIFNHIITRFGVPQSIVTNHGSHFRHYMVAELTSKLGLHHDSSMSYYPQGNGQVEAVNKVLVTKLQRMIGIHKLNRHIMLF